MSFISDNPLPGPPPQRPPASVPIGSVTWLTYFSNLDRWHAAVLKYLAAIAAALP